MKLSALWLLSVRRELLYVPASIVRLPPHQRSDLTALGAQRSYNSLEDVLLAICAVYIGVLAESTSTKAIFTIYRTPSLTPATTEISAR